MSFLRIRPMKSRFLDLIPFLPLGFVYFISLNHSFFWDTTHLASAQANWFFQNGLFSLYLPDSIDSGHPPLIGWLLALCWKCFGKGLLQSHLLMFPFLILLCIQWRMILLHCFHFNVHILLFLFFLNPYLLGQSMLVSPDIILIGGFGLFLHGILTDKKWKMIIGSIILSVVSLRGISCCVCLVLFTLYFQSGKIKTISDFIKIISLFIPAAFLVVGFLSYHYVVKGWIGYHTHSPWISSFEKVNFIGFLRNIIIASWRFCDQGLIFLWVFPLWILFHKRNLLALSKNTFDLLVLFILLFIFLLIPQLFYSQLLMHRYFIPLIFILSLLALSIVNDVKALTKKYLYIVILCLMSGFFWIYPQDISKGWDAMPLHYFYYQKRDNALRLISSNKIDKSKIGATFPYNISSAILDLSEDQSQFAELNFQSNEYILYSTISNDFTKKDINELTSNWEVKFTCGTWPVTFILYQRRKE
jgi:hypothetical protein